MSSTSSSSSANNDSSPLNYPYYKNILAPKAIGMSDKGTLSALGNDIDGLIAYTDLLVSGKGKASATGQPLGNRYFLETGATCTDPSGNSQDRYLYIDNIPAGNIPFIPAGANVNLSEFRGLIPGAMSTLGVLNPGALLNSFSSGNSPPCQAVTMETIDNSNVKSSETHYVALTDIQDINPCSFMSNYNPVADARCEGFTTLSPAEVTAKDKKKQYGSNVIILPKDPTAQLYLLSLSLIGIYFLYKTCMK
jgi:hypothetical protein